MSIFRRAPRQPKVPDTAPPETAEDTEKVSTPTDPTDALAEQWLKSPENMLSRTRLLFIYIPSAAAVYAGFFLFVLNTPNPSTATVVISVSIFVLGLCGLTAAAYARQAARATFYQRQDQAAKEGVDVALREIQNSTDLPALLRLNRSQMDQYENLTRRQANSSYRLAQMALALGFLIVISGSVAAIVTPASAAKTAVGVLTAVGGAVAGFIARTYLRVYERTLVQLNYYFQQPLITSYVLTAERLSQEVSEAKRDEAYGEIISHVLTAISQGFDPNEPSSRGWLPRWREPKKDKSATESTPSAASST